MKTASILFIDDEPGILRTLERMFRRDGYELHFASSAQEGLAIIENHAIDIVVTDYRMPEMDGVELLKRIQEISPDTLRIVLTGYANYDVALRAINEGHVFQFISKPWKEEEFRIIIQRCVEHIELLRENRRLQKELEKQNEQLKKLNQELEDRVLERTRELLIHNQALQVSQNILDSLPVPVMGVSLEGLIVSANREAMRFFGEPSSVVGMPIQELFPGEWQNMVQDFIHEAKKQDKAICSWKGKTYEVSLSRLQFTQNENGIVVLIYRLKDGN